jgi:hypothetical protein
MDFRMCNNTCKERLQSVKKIGSEFTVAILVEEGLHPNGMDLVKEARLNPVARANAVPQRKVEFLPIGEGYVVLGMTLEPMLDETQESLCAVLTVVGGRPSDLVPTIPVKLVLGELGRISLADLRQRLTQAIDGPKAPQ